jgi:carbonic anhydrase
MHKCKNILFKCMDFRMQSKTLEWLKENGYFGDCDVVSVAGSSKGIADDDQSVRNFLLNQIKISHDLHGAENIILIHHSDCGAYKGSYQFSSPEEEKQKQEEDMIKVENIAKESFPDMNIVKVWAEMKDPDGHEVTFTKI